MLVNGARHCLALAMQKLAIFVKSSKVQRLKPRRPTANYKTKKALFLKTFQMAHLLAAPALSQLPFIFPPNLSSLRRYQSQP